jgi:hypothetical protein
MRVQYLGHPLKAAADHVVKTLIGGEDKAEGAVIALGADGEVVINSNGYGILWGAVGAGLPAASGTREPPPLRAISQVDNISR